MRTIDVISVPLLAKDIIAMGKSCLELAGILGRRRVGLDFFLLGLDRREGRPAILSLRCRAVALDGTRPKGHDRLWDCNLFTLFRIYDTVSFLGQNESTDV
jgi:hypothetical protein